MRGSSKTHLIGKLLHKSGLSVMGLCSGREIGGKCARNMTIQVQVTWKNPRSLQKPKV